MSDIVIRLSNSRAAEEATISLLKSGFVPHRAEINYNVQKGLCPIEQEDLYPLRLYGILNGCCPAIIRVYSVTAGYGGTGPSSMVRILEEAGFQFDANDIRSRQCIQNDGWIHLVYTK